MKYILLSGFDGTFEDFAKLVSNAVISKEATHQIFIFNCDFRISLYDDKTDKIAEGAEALGIIVQEAKEVGKR